MTQPQALAEAFLSAFRTTSGLLACDHLLEKPGPSLVGHILGSEALADFLTQNKPPVAVTPVLHTVWVIVGDRRLQQLLDIVR